MSSTESPVKTLSSMCSLLSFHMYTVARDTVMVYVWSLMSLQKGKTKTSIPNLPICPSKVQWHSQLPYVENVEAD